MKDIVLGNFRRSKNRFTSKLTDDPFNTFDLITQLHLETGLPARFFWLLTDGKARENINPYPIPAPQKALMRELATEFEHGIHPGYGPLKEEELQRYRMLFGVTPRHSRQHFLQFSLPGTYRGLLRMGITNDHSMGYADAVGWRNGTNIPFYWYDLEREQQTSLIVHPFAAMDATLRKYLGLSPEAAKETVRRLYTNALPYGGPFPLLWHNSSFAEEYGWAGWWPMYGRLLRGLLQIE